MDALCGRLVLLHHLSDLFCSCLHMLDLSPSSSLSNGSITAGGSPLGVSGNATVTGSLRGVLFSAGKETAFKKVE